MSIILKRFLSMIYWLCGTPVGLVGVVVGFLVSFFLCGYKAALKLHESSIDVFDPKHNEN